MKYVLKKPPPKEIETILSDYAPIVRTLLFSRGITTKDDAEKFLNPQYELHSENTMRGIAEAVARITDAVQSNEYIVIYSDYDADGVPGSVILSDFFKKIGYEQYSVYIPHRNDEGFGLNKNAIRSLSESGAKLIITIDCGIADVSEVAYARTLGIDVIITDHHLPGEILPDAVAIVNPKHNECAYPDDGLCGSGVVFKLVQALVASGVWEIPAGWEKWLLDMVGIATLSDMVPLVGENRVLAHYGLYVLRKSRRPGLRELLRKNRILQATLTEDDVGFTISPRINAASRMGHPIDAYKLLSATTTEEAISAVAHLERINAERKKVVASMVREAHKKLKSRTVGSVVVIGNTHWKPSLVGLLANKLKDEYGKPAFVWGRGGDEGIKGSCRAPSGVNIVELMSRVPRGVLKGFGGHAQSGGFELTESGVHSFEEALNEVYSGEVVPHVHEVDALLSPEKINRELYVSIKQLAPFGQHNPKPVFMFEGVLIESVAYFGKHQEHTEIKIARDGTPLKGIAFFTKFAIESGSKASVIANIEWSTFGRKSELRLRVIDIF